MYIYAIINTPTTTYRRTVKYDASTKLPPKDYILSEIMKEGGLGLGEDEREVGEMIYRNTTVGLNVRKYMKLRKHLKKVQVEYIIKG
jgi:hypothetical protein